MAMLIPEGLIVDNFAGGGGASQGIELALGRPVDIAVNHDAKAIAMHRANHPHTKHFCENVYAIKPVKVTGGKPVALAWFSPDCTHHSRAKGGKPVKKTIRGLAWVVIRWAREVRPAVIILENVEEWRDWGPLGDDNKPRKNLKGQTFNYWAGHLQRLGYTVEWRPLMARDFGDPTSRKRLFLIARCDGRPIRWPQPTHGPPGNIKESGLIAFRTAADCIDWSIPCPSIFMTREEAKAYYQATGIRIKRPLVDNTMARIARGLKKFVLDAKEPFIIHVAHGYSGGRREYPITDPLGTVTGGGIVHGLVTPYLARIGQTGGNGGYVNGVDDPLSTITSKAEHLLIAPTLVQSGYGEREGQAPRSLDLHQPLGTVVAGGSKHALVTAFLAKHYGGATGAPIDTPLPTTTARGTQNQIVTSHLLKLKGTCRDGQPVTEPLQTVQAGGLHYGEVRAFLTKYYGASGPGQGLDEPLHTLSARDRMGLVTVCIGGEPYVIADIGMRMLTPRELFRAHSFPESFVIDPVFKGKPLCKTDQVNKVGNSVPLKMAKAVALAQFDLAAADAKTAAA